MTAKWEKQAGNEGVLTIEVSPEKFNESLDQAFKKVSKTIQVPGFRKGKIPRKIFENRFGVESLYQDAIDLVLPGAYSEALQETGIDPVAQPTLKDVGEIEQGKPLVVTFEVTVKPEVKLGEYKGLEVEVDAVEVTDAEVDEAINALREQQAELIVKEAGKIENGDTVVIDFEGFLDDKAFDGGKGENHSLEIGSGQFIPGFEEQLIGKTSGEESEIKITFPEDYHAEDLSGKDATFKVTIHEIKTKELPELNDDFAQDQDVDTFAELKSKKREELEAQKKQASENKQRDALIEQASENAEVNIPEAMIDTELNHMVQEFEQRLQAQGMTMEMYAQFSGQDQDALKGQMKESAEKRVQSNLTLEAIAEVEKIEVADADVDAEFEQMAKAYGTEIEQLKQMLGANTNAIIDDLKFRKTVDFLVENSKTK